MFEYDDKGNLIEVLNNNKSDVKYSYDFNNNLIGFSNENDNWCDVAYLNSMLYSIKCLDAKEKYFISDPFGQYGYNVIALSENNSPIEFFYHANQMSLGLLSSSINQQYRFYHSDFHYSIAAVSDESGLLDEFKSNLNSYDPYGNCLHPNKSSIKTTFLFQGRLGVIEIRNGTFLFRQRAYDANLGRFVSFDKKFLSGSKNANLYVFCENNPVNYIDPNGQSIFPMLNLLYGLFDMLNYVTSNPGKVSWEEALKIFGEGN